MAGYITQTDLEAELGADKLLQLTDPEGTGEVDAARVARAISFAEGTFDSYARTRYTLPVPTTEKVKSVCVDLAVYNLQRSRASTPEKAEALKKSLYDPAIAFLNAMSKGTAALDIPAAVETEKLPTSPDRVMRGSTKRRAVFDDEKLGGY